MASPSPARALSSAPSVCRSCRARFTRHSLRPNRSFSSATTLRKAEFADYATDFEDPTKRPPRWMVAPQEMQAPFRVRPPNKNEEWSVNEDPEMLDRILEAVLGASVRGSSLLREEVKWLIVTHRSFDHGRRGMNDRLAFLGRRIVELQASLALIDKPSPRDAESSVRDPWDREAPPTDPSLEGLENLTPGAKVDALDVQRMSGLAQRYGLQKVIRWKPRRVDNMKSSGMDSVLTQTLYAVVGAVALQRGGEAAVRTAKERILRPLGLL